MSLNLFTIFHLNLAYSAIEEAQRPTVIERCYWPILRLIRDRGIPFGIEAPGFTLETIEALDPKWIVEFRELLGSGRCEFVGSGYAQLIGPLVPAEVNAANLRLGHEVYERILGLRPALALVNEQAYSPGLIRHYLDAGYRAIIMEWDNPAHGHPEWDAGWRYLPQIACGPDGEEIPVLWNKSVAFQKFQRYAQGEIEMDEYRDYLRSHCASETRALSLYGNDAEIFDFRPGRYSTEPVLPNESEWGRIGKVVGELAGDPAFRFVRPSQVLDLLGEVQAGHRLRLESPDQPVPVKKQGKYNLTRWAVTGRDDLGINTRCWRLFHALKARGADENAWRELCFLWSSDFRTHITEARWTGFLRRLVAMELAWSVDAPSVPSQPQPAAGKADGGKSLTVETETVRLEVNTYRGLAINKLWFKSVSDRWMLGTLPHGFFDDIAMAADFYSGHLVFEAPGRGKITDLGRVIVDQVDTADALELRAQVSSELGPIQKIIRVFKSKPAVSIGYRLDWSDLPLGSLRLGMITLNPDAFQASELFYRCHNGGAAMEELRPEGRSVDQGAAISLTVSASNCLGATGGVVELGDNETILRVSFDPRLAAVVPMITHRQVGASYFFRLSFSAGEMDETRRLRDTPATHAPGPFEFLISAESRR